MSAGDATPLRGVLYGGRSGAVTPQDLAQVGPPEVPQELACAGCGYQLRGLRAAGRCPECGASVGQSLDAHAYTLSFDRHVRRLREGLGLIHVSVAALAAIWAVCTALAVWDGVDRPHSPSAAWAQAVRTSGADPGLWTVLAVPVLAAAALLALGGQHVTHADPRRLSTPAQRAARFFARGVMVAQAALLGALAVALPLAPRLAPSALPETAVAMVPLRLVQLLAAAGLLWALAHLELAPACQAFAAPVRLVLGLYMLALGALLVDDVLVIALLSAPSLRAWPALVRLHCYLVVMGSAGAMASMFRLAWLLQRLRAETDRPIGHWE